MNRSIANLKSSLGVRRLLSATGGWIRRSVSGQPKERPVVGLALGGGFAAAAAHIGVLRVLERNRIPIDRIAGSGAGSIIAAAYAGGVRTDEIQAMVRTMHLRGVAQRGPEGLAVTERLIPLLDRVLHSRRFEDLRIPLVVVATDLASGRAVVFRERGDVIGAVRASCAYPGLFVPVRAGSRHLVDGSISMEVPALPLRRIGAQYVIAAAASAETPALDPANSFSAMSRSIRILQSRTAWEWTRLSNAIIRLEVGMADWDCSPGLAGLIEAGERAALAQMHKIRSVLPAGEGGRRRESSASAA